MSTRKLAQALAVTIAFFFIAGLSLPGCPWFKMMKYQQSRDGYSYDTDNYDGPGPMLPTMRTPVAGTVPVGGGDIPVTLLDADQLLSNPMPGEQMSIARGKVLYGTFCTPCHGETGKEKGLVGQKFPFVLDLTADQAKARSDPYLYAMIRGGRGLMPGYGARVTPEERWDIVNYLRKLQGSPARAVVAGTAQTAE